MEQYIHICINETVTISLCRSEKANPIGETYGDICPAGYFCPTHSFTPTPCEPGTYNPDQQSSSKLACLDCPPGKYCEVAGQSNYTAECAPGMSNNKLKYM